MKGSYIEQNPLTQSYSIFSTLRASRPFQEKSICPFCPGSQEVPESFDGIKSLENKYPSLHPENEDIGSALPGKGSCEVVLYGSEHKIRLRDRDPSFITKLILHWKNRDKQIRDQHTFVEYVFPFENFGRDIGVSLDHPHGQLYSFPFIPKIVEQMQENLQQENCVLCTSVDEFFHVLFEYKTIKLLVPKFARWPWEIYIVPNSHISNLSKLDNMVIEELAKGLKYGLTAFYRLFNKEISYIMSVYQAPVKRNDFHFHIQIISPQITENRIKFRAGVETSLDVFINSIHPESARDRMSEVMKV